MVTHSNAIDPADVHIGWMLRKDIPQVLRIEEQSSEYAWTERDFLQRLQQRNCISMVAEQGSTVVGFMIYEVHRSRLHILKLAVRPGYRQRGLGAKMVAKVISKLSSRLRQQIILKVPETQLHAQLFFSKLGFRAIQILFGYYQGSDEDAILMEYRFGGTDEHSAESEEISCLGQCNQTYADKCASLG